MNLSTVAEFSGAALILPIIMQAIRSAVPVPDKMILATLIVLSALWGVALYYSNMIAFSPAPFVVQVLLTAAAASGVHGQVATFFPAVDNTAKPVIPAPVAPPIAPQGPTPPAGA